MLFKSKRTGSAITAVLAGLYWLFGGIFEDWFFGLVGDALQKEGIPLISIEASLRLVIGYGPPVLLITCGLYYLFFDLYGKISLARNTSPIIFYRDDEGFDLIIESDDIKSKIEQLEMMRPQTPLEVESKDRQISDLNQRKAALDEKMKSTVLINESGRVLLNMLSKTHRNDDLLDTAERTGDAVLFLSEYIAKKSSAVVLGQKPGTEDVYEIDPKTVQKAIFSRSPTNTIGIKSGFFKKTRYEHVGVYREDVNQFLIRTAKWDE